MLNKLKLQNLGPADKFDLSFGARLTVITGDNSLGKSFILDNAWWALTGVWPAEYNQTLTSGLKARPKDVETSRIAFTIESQAKKLKPYSSKFDLKRQAWTRPVGRPTNPGLVIYAMADGAFAVWDPARNYLERAGEFGAKLPAYVFSAKNIWNGLSIYQGDSSVCEGLIRDLTEWIKAEKDSKSESLASIIRLLNILIPQKDTAIEFGQPIKDYDINEAREMPTIKYVGSDFIPITFASSAVKRILGLVYLIHWAWIENRKWAKRFGEEAAKQLTLIVDEPEVHLHPKWQRKILPALLEVFGVLSAGNAIQIIASTHSPLVLGSLEDVFDAKTDKWYDIDLVSDVSNALQEVVLQQREFKNYGEYSMWLTGEAFDFETSKTKHADDVYKEALAFIESGNKDLNKLEELNKKVSAAFDEEAPFSIDWKIFYLTRKNS